jgi:molybdopterin converting factor small subunit
MQINLWLWGHLPQFLSAAGAETYPSDQCRKRELPEGMTIRGLIDHLGIPDWTVDLVSLNGVLIRELETGLKEGDTVGLFPRILAGG